MGSSAHGRKRSLRERRLVRTLKSDHTTEHLTDRLVSLIGKVDIGTGLEGLRGDGRPLGAKVVTALRSHMRIRIGMQRHLSASHADGLSIV